jgi:hypothetical protein
MALWSAAHFSETPDLGSQFASLGNAVDEMWQDEKFQEMRFGNLLKELRMRIHERLLDEHARARHSCVAAPFVTLDENNVWKIDWNCSDAITTSSGLTAR